jgi:8-oxo-dGTP diphosphatase
MFSGDLEDLKLSKENDEAEQIVLWDKKKDIGYIDDIDEKLLEYY